MHVGTAPVRERVRHNRYRLRASGGLVCAFILGGVGGALGFAYLGFVCVLPLAALLLALSIPPLLLDVPRIRTGRGAP
jgi:hypothetical protein